MSNFPIILIAGLVTWWLVHEIFYSPKAQIKRLWKESLNISYKIGQQRKENADSHDLLINEYEKIIRKKKILINALLDYYFDPEEDQEYIAENRP